MKGLKFLIILLVLSCGNERIVQLPEVEQSEIAEVLDVSPAYIFYDPTASDSTKFNRKNLIGTTNWLVNVDKRLSLKQVVPHLKYLQAKREKKGMHTNVAAKNYFTCNDIAQSTLGFLDFTDIKFHDSNELLSTDNGICIMRINSLNDVSLSMIPDLNMEFSKENLRSILVGLGEEEPDAAITLVLHFNKGLSFQDYITVKSELRKIKPKKINIDSRELFY
ncbi:hypothetical protein [Winogradskyella aurantiaca]|uniref:hypothetical protein n=1 Tax=Winogradskyella aurantiaca TaxID=2219558 RepID=UPI000E1C72DB|nr:hypothetical protein [Winogradskyella aurantiaca]